MLQTLFTGSSDRVLEGKTLLYFHTVITWWFVGYLIPCNNCGFSFERR